MHDEDSALIYISICKMHANLLSLFSRAPLMAPGLETGNVCMLPVWDTGQLILHCQHSSIHNEDITLVWWIKVSIIRHYNDTPHEFLMFLMSGLTVSLASFFLSFRMAFLLMSIQNLLLYT